jgi:hypothetical protein
LNNVPSGWDRIGLGIAVFAATAFTLAMGFAGVRAIVREHSFQRHRAEAAGDVFQREIAKVVRGGGRRGKHPSERWRPEISVGFTVNGVRYVSKYVDRLGTVGSHEWADEVAARYPVGKHVTVYFNSVDPEDACLDPTTQIGTYTSIYAACFTTLVGGLFSVGFRTKQFHPLRWVGGAWIVVALATGVHYLILTGFRPTLHAVGFLAFGCIVGMLLVIYGPAVGRSLERYDWKKRRRRLYA